MKHNVILMQTGLETTTTKETIQEMLPDANIIVSVNQTVYHGYGKNYLHIMM